MKYVDPEDKSNVSLVLDEEEILVRLTPGRRYAFTLINENITNITEHSVEAVLNESTLGVSFGVPLRYTECDASVQQAFELVVPPTGLVKLHMVSYTGVGDAVTVKFARLP